MECELIASYIALRFSAFASKYFRVKAQRRKRLYIKLTVTAKKSRSEVSKRDFVWSSNG